MTETEPTPAPLIAPVNFTLDEAAVDARVTQELDEDVPLRKMKEALVRVTEQWDRDMKRLKDRRQEANQKEREAIKRQAEARAEAKKYRRQMSNLLLLIQTTPKAVHGVNRRIHKREKIVRIMARQRVLMESRRRLAAKLKL